MICVKCRLELHRHVLEYGVFIFWDGDSTPYSVLIM